MPRGSPGQPKSPEHRAALSAALKGHRQSLEVMHQVAVGRSKWRQEHPTLYELALRFFLVIEAGFKDARFEHVFGPYTVDAFVPSRGLVFESDAWKASFARRGAQYQEARDAYLMAEHSVLAVVYFGRADMDHFRDHCLAFVSQLITRELAR